MRTLSSILVALALVGCYATVGEEGRTEDGRMDGQAEFTLILPAVLPLVVIQPGVSVVRDYDHEVFYADGYYWARADRAWYRTAHHRGRWARVEDRRVPATIAQIPPGRYRHYQGDDHPRSDQARGRQDDHGKHGEHGHHE